MKGIGKFLSEAFFPLSYTCDICGIETFDGNICPECAKTITYNNVNTCPICGRKTFRPEICYECKADAPLFKKAVSPLIYEGGATVLIANFKNGQGYLKEFFADLIKEKLANFPELDYIVFVPMTKKAQAKRGYNQAELLAESVSERINVPVIKVIEKIKETSEQKSLSFKERAENLKTCFKIVNGKQIKDKNLLLIDDVLTTGATAGAICARLLKAGAAHVYLATVVSVEYKLKK